MAISFTMGDFYDKISSANNVYVHPKAVRKQVRTADEDVQNMQGDIANFRKKVRALENYSSATYYKSKIEKQWKGFTDAYNDLKDKYESVSDNKELSETLMKLDETINDHAKQLRKVGVKINDKGKLSFDSDKFDEAKKSDIETLLTGNDSFIRKTTKIVRNIDKNAQTAEYFLKEINVNIATRYSEEAVDIANKATFLHKSVESSQEMAAKITEGTLAASEALRVNDYNKSFVETYNEMIGVDDFDSDYIGHIINQTKNKENMLSEIGISIQEDNKLTVQEKDEVQIEGDAFKNAYTALFEENAAYANLIKTYTKEIFKSVLNTDNLGISIDQSV